MLGYPDEPALASYTQGTLILRPKKWHRLIAFIACAVTTAVGLRSILEAEPIGWLLVGLGAPCTVALLGLLLPTSLVMTLDSEGFTYCTWYRRHSIPWNRVGGFGVVYVWPTARVGYRGVVPAEQARQVSNPGASFAERETIMATSFGMNPQDLATLLNDWRSRSLGIS